MRMASFARLAHLTQKLGMLVPVVWLGFLVAMVVASWPQPALAQLSCPVTQITPTSGLNFGVSMNAAGTHITFTSTLDLTGGNSDLNQEVFMFNTTTSTFTQITTTTGGHEPGGGISGDSTKIVVLSNADFTGGNPDSSQELFLFDLATSTFT